MKNILLFVILNSLFYLAWNAYQFVFNVGISWRPYVSVVFNLVMLILALLYPRFYDFMLKRHEKKVDEEYKSWLTKRALDETLRACEHKNMLPSEPHGYLYCPDCGFRQ